jgi:excisionase family DNA binding protein
MSRDTPNAAGHIQALLTEKEVRGLLNIGRSTLHTIIRSKQLTAIKVGRQWRFRQSDVDRYLAERENTRES